MASGVEVERIHQLTHPAMPEYKSTQHFIAMLSIEEIYISALKTKMGEWTLHFTQIKIKEWMQELLDEKVSAEIIRYTMLTCHDVGSESQLKIFLENMFGFIYTLMMENDIEISVTVAWRLIKDSIQYGDPEGDPMDVFYSRENCLEAKKKHDETVSAGNKRVRIADAPSQVHGVHVWLEEMKGLSE